MSRQPKQKAKGASRRGAEQAAAAPPEISTTAAAILGLVAVQEGSAYDLAQRMKLNHHFIWPRAESKLYEEVKRLHALGLVDAMDEPTGRRRRTVYRILPLGERALTSWAKRASEAPSLSFETLVKLAYADYGTIEDARAQVGAIRELALQWIKLGRSLASSYLEGRVQLPQRVHTNALVWRFLAEYALALLAWADLADATLEDWDGVAPSLSNAEASRRLFEDGLRRFDEALARRDGHRR
jgi:DNA-binding PadR family transcriptional regulator